MKQVVFISGKGGTGKSTVVSSLSLIVHNKMMADCDVETPNLHILIKGESIERRDYFGGKKAVIDYSVCMQCGRCWQVCRFGAISKKLEVLPMKCEGCGVCALVCPCNAIRLDDEKTGEVYVSSTDRGTFSYALLDIGGEGSGKLVTEVRKSAEGQCKGEEWLLIDGSPGIGCPVIASITGADAVVAVTEPTMSGLSDLERVLDVARHFGIPAFVCINKYDLNPEITEQIERFCQQNGFPVIGKIPFDPAIVEALKNFKTPVEAGNVEFTDEVVKLWHRLVDELKKLTV
ncbi:ATP-binding protein [Caldicoprobacter algeriensis]|uniref:ATP-binding protein n=1 Tax=Caldicoprobacter algeriensis TaxID=699281 RepID=UPI00207AE70B|nr:ATP-binding protein [Caldicoprobacter algeriensis]MCM8900249.1 ATP-binding protein [Caldicoprobacter algeriensis]